MICSDIWHKYYELYFEIVIQAVKRVKFDTILKYHDWYLCQILRTNHAIICFSTTRKHFVIFTCRYSKLS